MLHKADLFLKPSELPKTAKLCWGIFNDRLELIKLSEPLYKLVNKPIAAILKQPLSHAFSALTLDNIDFNNRHIDHVINFVDDKGNALQATMTPIEESDQHWCITVIVIELDKAWLSQLHPDYHQAILSSDDWLNQIEEVINARPDLVFTTAINQGLSLTHSKVGYLHKFDEKKNQIVSTAWNEAVADYFTLSKGQEYKANSGIWAETIRSGKPVIHNDLTVLSKNNTQEDGFFAFKNHLCVPIHYRKKLVGIIGVGNRDTTYTQVDAKSLSIFATILWHCIELPRTMKAVSRQSSIIKIQKEKMTSILVQLIGAISEALELKDAYTAGHQKSVAQLSYLIGEKMSLPPDRLEGLKLGSLIHDIGKLAIPSQILSKTSKLSDAEFGLVKQHPEQGALIVSEVDFPWPIKQMILQHHERLDGSGYPKGLKADDIILEAKIIAVADVAESILSHRPYRPALGMAVLTQDLLKGRGKIYDEVVVDACLDILASKDFKDAGVVSGLLLAPVVFLEEYHTLEHAEAMMKKAKMDVAVVLSEQHRTPIGVIDNNTLAFWHSPFLDTAAERAVDRSLLNKRVHQVMMHKVDMISDSTILNDAKLMMETTNANYLIVHNDKHQVIGMLTWKILANALLVNA
ncbi:HD domain-containing protein [Shewanella sp. SR43-4]|uniref:HD domain-containing phosphohydrolase n=2 Tax=Shewanellaceae TaxID=267890 RepID=UPI000C5336D3|nr:MULTISPECIES: HD domain-containing phosphohydrolase [Shewanella]NCQ46214.1 HD domain-containing protein [Shewanella frigidimarina]MBB1318260.1 HD domain-containing protein [Shewanella sp. SR43-4]MBB1320064.1 HD domain-containing protein [Shewanella sp. SR43-8]NCO73047.1 HD domain-containing protein [Shewanella vesiculosa]NCP38499.1 HD domain-containing protein [Shewanella vesiculosa]